MLTIRAQLYNVLLTTATALCNIQEHLIEHEALDPDDELFDAANEAFQGIAPILVRLHAAPELPPTISAFLSSVAGRTEAGAE